MYAKELWSASTAVERSLKTGKCGFPPTRFSHIRWTENGYSWCKSKYCIFMHKSSFFGCKALIKLVNLQPKKKLTNKLNIKIKDIEDYYINVHIWLYYLICHSSSIFKKKRKTRMITSQNTEAICHFYILHILQGRESL